MPADAGGATLTTLSVDVGGTHARLALVRDGLIVARDTRRTTDLAGSDHDVTTDLVDAACALAERAVARSEPYPAAVGVSLAAAVDFAGSVLQPREFGIPAGTRVRDAFAAAFGVPVPVDNDANLAALAEARFGAARGCRSVAVITIGTNIGLGLVFDGAVHRGANGAAGEIGLTLVPATPVGRSADGRAVVDAGCLGRAVAAGPSGYAFIEDLVGGAALAAAARAAGIETRAVLSDAARDPHLTAIVDRAVEGWALVIANLAVVLDLDRVVVTGSLAQDAAHLLDRLRARVAELVSFAPEIRLGSVGPDAELLGADLLARAALASRVDPNARAGLSAQSRGEDR